MIVSIRNDGVETVVAASHLHDDEDVRVAAVAACTALSAASECSAENVFAKKSARSTKAPRPEPSSEETSRRVLSVISLFIS